MKRLSLPGLFWSPAAMGDVKLSRSSTCLDSAGSEKPAGEAIAEKPDEEAIAEKPAAEEATAEKPAEASPAEASPAEKPADGGKWPASPSEPPERRVPQLTSSGVTLSRSQTHPAKEGPKTPIRCHHTTKHTHTHTRGRRRKRSLNTEILPL